jgi:hypothetical protein
MWVEIEKKTSTSDIADSYGSALAILSGSLIGFNKVLIGSELGEGHQLNTGIIFLFFDLIYLVSNEPS